jgi:hypothetical protein
VKAEGFSRMDVNTSIHNDPKFKSLARLHPKLAAAALAAYIVLLAESWREGRRLTLVEAWSLFPFDRRVAEALAEALLVDSEGRVPDPAWETHFGAADDRRRNGRERYRRADVKRGRTKASADVASRQPDSQSGQPVSPSGQPGSPSVQRVTPSVTTAHQPDRSSGGPTLDHRAGDGDVANIAICPGCHQPLDLSDASNVTVPFRDGRPWHVQCPDMPSLTSAWVHV